MRPPSSIRRKILPSLIPSDAPDYTIQVSSFAEEIVIGQAWRCALEMAVIRTCTRQSFVLLGGLVLEVMHTKGHIRPLVFYSRHQDEQLGEGAPRASLAG
jgi:hypothetical protein